MKEDIIKRCSSFNLERFYFDDSDEDLCAIKIITPIQDICFTTEYHDRGAELIMRALYSDFDQNFSADPYWPEVCMSYGCVAIQILKHEFVIINIPDFINKYQFNELFGFYQDMVKINAKLRKKGEEIELQTNVSRNGEFLNLGKALMFFKNKVVEFKNDNEKNIKI